MAAVPLGESGTIAVVGGGPGGAFFAMEALRLARERGHRIRVIILEQKRQVLDGTFSLASREGCGYCAGGVSPRLADALEADGLRIPEEIIQSHIESLTIQGNWKHIELAVPPGRRVFAVYRGSRPYTRIGRYNNFDSFLLASAISAGAEVVTAEVSGLGYSDRARPVVSYTDGSAPQRGTQKMEADFVVIACGVNQRAGMSVEDSTLTKSLTAMIPEFRPPRVRRTLICELRGSERELRNLRGEMYFVEYGSRRIRIEMSSLVLKEEGFVTLALLGDSIDRADKSEGVSIIEGFLALPHVKRLLPHGTRLEISCACWPNMTIGAARHPFGERVAIVGDMAAARLYKDGILSAHTMANALAHSVIEQGVDAESLRRSYWPVVRSVKRDNHCGRTVFMMNRIAFSRPTLSRILYQAVLTERRTTDADHRLLEQLLWKIASGDDTYERILLQMARPATMASLLVGGVLVTFRNYLTEVLFGLHWGEIGRFPTGVYREVVDAKRKEYRGALDLGILSAPLEFERMYSIQIKAPRESILCQLGKFGEEDMEYFRPRIVRVHKISGYANEVGKMIRYSTPIRGLGFTIRLESLKDGKYLVYRVMDGFGKGGVLIFDVDEVREDVHLLSIYVAYNFPRGRGLPLKLYWKVFKALFPQYIHDVLWNHALCELKEIVEQG
ncbi:MAG TPA: hypothetical protein VGM51_18150 [Armatimonadota bacterium]|jgi:flavin-dependent dehydrogenase